MPPSDARKGHARPGELIVGADSHTCTYGAFGALATGIGSTEMAAVFVTGALWFKVPKVIKVNTTGRFQDFVTAKDLILNIIGQIKVDGAIYDGLEYAGPTVQNLSIDGRMVRDRRGTSFGLFLSGDPTDLSSAPYECRGPESVR